MIGRAFRASGCRISVRVPDRPFWRVLPHFPPSLPLLKLKPQFLPENCLPKMLHLAARVFLFDIFSKYITQKQTLQE